MPAPVLVAGAGPVGLTAALTLAREGVPVTVLEAGPGLAAESRASTFHPPTLELLQELGVVEPLLAAGLQAPTFQYRDRQGGVVAELDLAVLVEDTRYPFRLQCEQDKLCRLLLDALADLPHVEVRFGAHVSAAATDGDGVVVTAGGEVVRGSWLVAADGAHSAVRRSLGVGFEGLTYPERFLVVSTTKELREVFPGLALVAYVADPDEWLVLLRTPDHWRVLFPVSDDAPLDDLTSAAAVQARMSRVADLPGGWPVAHTTCYRVHQRMATRFRVGRVLFAGDAAHVNNPLGGMGMNSGIHDGVSAGRRVAAVLTGSDDALLDEYATRRRAVALDYVARSTHANYAALRERDPRRRAEHQAALRSLAADKRRSREHLLSATMLTSARSSL